MQVHAMGGRVGDHAGQRQYLRHIHLGLGRQVQIPEARRQPRLLVRRHRPLHGPLAGVVSRQGQQPVAAEHPLQARQVFQRGLRRGINVIASIIAIDQLQAIIRRRAGDELPDAGGLLGRNGGGLEAALDHRHHGQIHGQATALDLVHDIKQKRLGPLRQETQAPRRTLDLVHFRRDPFLLDAGQHQALAHTVPNAILQGLARRRV